MDVNQVERFFKRLSGFCGEKISPHRYRHTLATDLMEEPERNIKLTQMILDHASIGTALRQTQALMAEYSVSQEDIALADVDMPIAEASSGKTPPRYVRLPESLVCHAFGTSTVHAPFCDERGRIHGASSSGPDAVTAAAYAFAKSVGGGGAGSGDVAHLSNLKGRHQSCNGISNE